MSDDDYPHILPDEPVPGVSVSHDDDGSPLDSGPNLLRERTFNPELRDLVNRVKRTGPEASPPPPPIPELAGLDTMSHRELLIGLYRLFYQARNLLDNRDSNLSFNPFDVAMDSLGDDLEGLLRSIMTECGCPEFSLLVYDLSSRAFIPAINTIPDLDGDNLVISLHDPLYHAITTAPEGIMLDGPAIYSDTFFKKKFMPAEGIEPGCWFMATERLTAPLVEEIITGGGLPPRTMGISPILMVRVSGDDAFDPAALTKIFAVRLPVPILLLEAELSSAVLPEAGLAATVIAMESHLNYRLMRGGGVAAIISILPAERGYFMLAYLRHRLGRILPVETLFIHPMAQGLVILSDESCRAVIEETFADYAVACGTDMMCEVIPINEENPPADIVRKILYPR